MSILNLCQNENTKTVGLHWDTHQDALLFNIVAFDSTILPTKQHILTSVGEIFDPLGLPEARTVRAKIILQILWQQKLDCDVPIDGPIGYQWCEAREDLLSLNKLRIPRRIHTKGGRVFQLHGFGDASEKAYGACVYLLRVNDSGEVTRRLIASK